MAEKFTHGYALLIGIGESAYSKLSLPVTVKDTQAIYAALIDSDLCAYPDDQEHIRILRNVDLIRPRNDGCNGRLKLSIVLLRLT